MRFPPLREAGQGGSTGLSAPLELPVVCASCSRVFEISREPTAPDETDQNVAKVDAKVTKIQGILLLNGGVTSTI